MLENLAILLSDEDNNSSKSSIAEICLPTIDDALKVVLSKCHISKVDHPIFEINELCVNVWNEGEKIRWYIGYFRSIKNTDIFEVEQLVRVNENSDLCWVHPTNPIMDEVDSEQIIRDKNGKRQIVVGSWNLEDLTSLQSRIFMRYRVLLKALD